MLEQSSMSVHDEYVVSYYESLSCARSLACCMMYTYGEHRQLAELSFNPMDYNDLVSARDSLAATKFLSKATFLQTDIDLRAAALDGFAAAEQKCAETNRRIESSSFKNTATHSVLQYAMRKIDSVLGDFDADELVDSCDWGPGATTTLPRRLALPSNKYSTECCITVDAYDFVKPFIDAAYPLWGPRITIQGHSKVVTVPKDAKKDRTIAIEPSLNLWFQKGVGAMIRRRLSRVGIDLEHQYHNAQKSRLGSKFNHLATVDFSSASDTVSRSLVWHLLCKGGSDPGNRWYVLLDRFRSKYAVIDDRKLTLEKFSSMGNGFTFELETLIFFALACGVCRELGVDDSDVSVYGDDVILPSAAYALYQSICEDLGFAVNQSKSYPTGYYRESCGAHWWNGVDIKPIFQKEKLCGPEQICKSANSVRRLAHRRNSFGCDKSFRRCWLSLAAALGCKFPRISDGFGDLGLVVNIDEPHVHFTVPRNWIEGYQVRVHFHTARQLYVDGDGLLLHRIRSLGLRNGNPDDHSFRDSYLPAGGNLLPQPLRTKSHRIRLLMPRWVDLGPWI